MLKKCIFYCFASMLVVTVLNTPVFASMGADRIPIAHTWPELNTPNPDATLEVYSYLDPNSPEGATGPGQRVQENFDNGRGLMQTFTVTPYILGPAPGTPKDGNGGFTLTNIVITDGGATGSEDNYFSAHIFDINLLRNTSDGEIWQRTNAFRVDTDGVGAVAYDWLSSECSFQFLPDDNAIPLDYFVILSFDGYDAFDLEPNHMYDFEIWGPYANAGMYWIRDAYDNNYVGGRGYNVSGDTDGPGAGRGPADFSNSRNGIAGNQRDMTLGVYGVLANGKAYHPTPRVLEPEADVAPTLTWAPGKWADDTQGHQVWFSTSWSSVNTRSSSANKGRVTNASFSPGTLAFNKRYYWRVDEYNDTPPPTPPDTNTNDSSKYWGGAVWQFVTVGPWARLPQPASGQTAEFDIKAINLSWTAGVWASDTDGHRVYFGTDKTEVANADTSTDVIYRGQQTATTFDLRTLVPDYTLTAGTYYWRIDEVNEGTAGSPWIGPVWNFSMPTYLVVDAFTYSSNAALQLMWRMHLKKANCAPGLECVPAGTISMSSGAMRMDYENSGDSYCGWSEVKMDNNGLGLDMDWTAGGLTNLTSLSIGVDGNIFSGSDLVYDNLYVALEDDSGNIGVVFCNDHYRQMRQFGQVQNWYIDLDDLNNGTPGVVKLDEVNSLYIGLGPRCTAGGNFASYGRINVDNIRLNMPICRTAYSGYGINCAMKGTQEGDFAGNFNAANNWLPGDCDVDFFDLDYFANVWTDKARNLDFTADMQAPLNDAAHLMVRYEFDETSGSKAYDSSGNSRDANIGNPNPLMWSNSKISGTGCLNLEGGLRTWVEVPTSAYNDDTNGVTFCFWSAYDMNYQPDGALAATWSSVFTFHSKVPTEANAGGGLDDSQLIESQTPTPWPPGHEWGPQIRYVDMRGGVNVGRSGQPWVKYSNFGMQWNHYVYLYDDINKIKSIYENGEKIGEVKGGVTDPNDVNVPLPIWQNIGSFKLATRGNTYYDPSRGFMGPNWGFWYGKLDDFRVYNYALTDKEIHYIATKGTGLRTIQLIDPANLANTGASAQQIDFADYAIFIKNWLKEDFWP